MGVLERLTEEEKYLYSILSDPSGLDQAEFLHHVYDTTDGCFRAFPFQWKWWRDTSKLQLDYAARSIGKTWGIAMRLCAFPLLYPGESALLTAPELVHLRPITSRIESQILETRLLRSFLPKGRSTGVTHRPFRMEFVNGAVIEARLPQRDGKGIKGAHPVVLEIDEGQDMPEAAYFEVIETLQRNKENTFWRIHGVTRGIGDYFDGLTQPDSGFKIHRYTSMDTPTWTEADRTHRETMYGSAESPDYKRNVLGQPGDTNSPFVVLTRLMQCVDTDLTSEYNSKQYICHKIDDGLLKIYDGNISALLLFPPADESVNVYGYYAGMDVGFTNSPSEILVFAQERPDMTKPYVLRLVARVQLRRITHIHQVETILQIIEHFNIKSFGVDKTGLGLPLYQDLQQRAPEQAHIIKGYNFSEKILVELDYTIDIDEVRDNVLEKAGIKKNVLEASSDALRSFIDAKRIILPFDKDLLGEIQGQTYHVVKDHRNIYGRKIYSQGKYHCLIAGTLVTTSEGDKPIESVKVGDLVATRKGWKPVIDAWQTNPAAKVMTVDFSNGRQLTGTPEHRVWTHRGWASLSALRMGDSVGTWLPPNQKWCGSRETSSIGTQTQNDGRIACTTEETSPRAYEPSTRKSGRRTMDPFQKGTTFITEITTPSTMILQTCNASRVNSTRLFTEQKIIPTFKPQSTWLILKAFVLRRRNGIRPRRGWSGTDSTESPLGRVGKFRSLLVQSALDPTNRAYQVCTVQRDASNGLTRRIQPNKNLGVVVSVVPHSRCSDLQNDRSVTTVVRVIDNTVEVPVYDLTIADAHEFYANGILVHNCLDAFRMAMLAITQEPMEELVSIERYKSLHAEPVMDLFGW